jgi:nucleotide-binding universal stress UspA family protein
MKKVFNKIIAPVDGSSSSKKTVKKAISIAKATNLYVLALHVIQTPLTGLSFSFKYGSGDKKRYEKTWEIISK